MDEVGDADVDVEGSGLSSDRNFSLVSSGHNNKQRSFVLLRLRTTSAYST